MLTANRAAGGVTKKFSTRVCAPMGHTFLSAGCGCVLVQVLAKAGRLAWHTAPQKAGAPAHRQLLSTQCGPPIMPHFFQRWGGITISRREPCLTSTSLLRYGVRFSMTALGSAFWSCAPLQGSPVWHRAGLGGCLTAAARITLASAGPPASRVCARHVSLSCTGAPGRRRSSGDDGPGHPCDAVSRGPPPAREAAAMPARFSRRQQLVLMECTAADQDVNCSADVAHCRAQRNVLIAKDRLR